MLGSRNIMYTFYVIAFITYVKTTQLNFKIRIILCVILFREMHRTSHVFANMLTTLIYVTGKLISSQHFLL